MALCHPERKHVAKDLCGACYERSKKARRKPGTVATNMAERIALRTDRSAGPDGCWLWSAKLTKGGIPMVFDGQRSHPVRRLVWQAIHGPVPEGRAATITCGTRGCVHPAHLELVFFKSDAVERFWSHVDMSGGPEACWPWKEGHARFKRGYGMFIIGWKKPVVQGSRHAYEITHGVTLETEDFVMHSCDNPPCCNPAHLSKGNALLNHRDMVAKGRAAWQKPKTGTDPT